MNGKRYWMVTLGLIPAMWFALRIAPGIESGVLSYLPIAMKTPFHIEWCDHSLKSIFIAVLAYLIAVGVFFSSKGNYRRGEEHGSAKWGVAKTVNRKYADKDRMNNKVLTKNVSIGLNGREHRRNLNVLVCGGSGAGKTRFYAKPNIMNANTSFVILDPKGQLN